MSLGPLHNSRQEGDMADTRLELPNEGGFTDQYPDDSYSSGAELQINPIEIKTINPWTTLDHPYIMRQGGATLEEYKNTCTLEFEEAYREKTGASDFRKPYKTSYCILYLGVSQFQSLESPRDANSRTIT